MLRALSPLLLAGCLHRVPVAIDVQTVPPVPDAGSIVPQFLELRHSEQGWLHVDFDEPRQAAAGLKPDVAVEVASEQLPRGRYDAVRFGYLARVDGRWTTAETVVLQPFCIGSALGSNVVVQVSLEPSALSPAQVDVNAPPCREE